MLTVTVDNFESEVLQEKGAVLLDFWATWCGPCRMFGPILEQFAARHPEIKVGKIDVDEEPGLAMQHDVMSIPSIVLYRDGVIVKRDVGVKPLAALEAWIK